jgi:6-phosphogluconolactonase
LTNGAIVVLPSPAALAARAADEFIASCAAAIRDHGVFSVAFSGGTTPKAMLTLLGSSEGSARVDWDRVHAFWSDERCVAPDDPASNFGMADAALLSRVPIPPGNVHRMRGEVAPQDGAADYVRQLESYFGGPPAFDIVFLGLGPDGHTASLFPGTTALDEAARPCVANRVDSHVASPWRLTLTYPAINSGRRVVFLVEGDEKAAIFKAVVKGERDPRKYPAQGVEPASGDLLWLVDVSAASAL